MAVNNCVKYLLFFFNLLFWVSLAPAACLSVRRRSWWVWPDLTWSFRTPPPFINFRSNDKSFCFQKCWTNQKSWIWDLSFWIWNSSLDLICGVWLWSGSFTVDVNFLPLTRDSLIIQSWDVINTSAGSCDMSQKGFQKWGFVCFIILLGVSPHVLLHWSEGLLLNVVAIKAHASV